MFEFERPRGGERALLVHVNLAHLADQDDLAEFVELVRSAGVEDADLVVSSRQNPSPRTFVGQGKLEELCERVQQLEVDVVLFNNALTPSQERNLERELKCRVLDRTGLILDIFAQRAQSFEGKLQVELAQLRHLSTRLVRGWTHLERQKGGIGLRGPGETQLETDRRLLAKRIQYLRSRLQKVERQREQSRQARNKAEIPTLSLVGYTNAGKSTLFNALTEADAYAADQLFATLDPTLRKLPISDQLEVILADTVGFIRHLPHDLVAAFRATLQETRDADLILHVIDCADDERDEKIEAVERVLEEVGAADTPQLMIFNKIDLTDVAPRIDRDEEGRVVRVWLSAQTGEGFEQLREVIHETFAATTRRCRIRLQPDEGQLRARFHEDHLVREEQYAEDGSMELLIELSDVQLRRLQRHLDIDPQRFRFEAEPGHDKLAGVA